MYVALTSCVNYWHCDSFKAHITGDSGRKLLEFLVYITCIRIHVNETANRFSRGDDSQARLSLSLFVCILKSTSYASCIICASMCFIASGVL